MSDEPRVPNYVVPPPGVVARPEGIEALTSTPSASQTITVAQGQISSLDPALAAELKEIGNKLKAGGVNHVSARG